MNTTQSVYGIVPVTLTLKSTPVEQMVSAIMSSVEGLDWPPEAVYKMSYRLKCWPTTWSRHKAFASSKDELREWYASYLDWTKLEDNYFELTGLEEWDLGPNQVNEPEGFIKNL